MPVISMFYGIIVDELVADWELAANGQKPYRIEPLR
jgi:hypothetical protein